MFSFLNKMATKVSVDRIAKACANPEAFDGGGVTTAFTTNDVMAAFFSKYGTTEKRYDYHPKPGLFAGYVRVPDIRDEFLCIILMLPENKGSVVACFTPEISFGKDLLGLMAKADFANKIVAHFKTNSSW